MSAEDEERFQLSNICWICDELFDAGDNKVRDHCHIAGKYRGSANWSCNINLKVTNSHLIMQEIGKFGVKVLYQMD